MSKTRLYAVITVSILFFSLISITITNSSGRHVRDINPIDPPQEGDNQTNEEGGEISSINSWPFFGNDKYRSHRSDFDSSYLDGKIKWKLKTGSIITFSSPVIDKNDNIYIGSNDNQLYAVENDGNLLWTFKGEGSSFEGIHSSPAIDENQTIYFGSRDNNLYAINKNGTLKWKFETDGNIDSSPVIGNNGILYFGSEDHNLYALYPNGTKKWNFKTNGWVKSSPAVGPDNIYFGSYDRKFYAINKNGTVNWTFSSNQEIFSSPTLGFEDSIYFGSWDGKLYSLNKKGKQNWNVTIGSRIFSSPGIDNNGNIYIGSDDGNLYKINSNSSVIWNYSTGDKIRSSPSIDSNGIIYVGSKDGSMYSINSNGTLRWSYKTDNKIDSSPSIDSNGSVYIGSQDGYLYSFTGSPLPPNNVSAVGYSNRIELSWSPPTETAGSEIKKYNIYRGKNSDNLEYITDVNGTNNSFIDTNLTNGKTYYYQISAVNKYYEGERSVKVHAIPHNTTTSAPLNLTFSIVKQGVKLNWDEPLQTDNNILFYNIYRGIYKKNKSLIESVTNDTNYYLDKNVSLGKTYNYHVTAVNDIGESGPSNEINVTVILTPSAPKDITISIIDSGLKINWSEPEIDGGCEIIGYGVYRGKVANQLNLISKIDKNRKYFVDTNISKGSTYFYSISAFNEVGEGNKSSPEKVRFITKPSSPRNLSLNLEGYNLTLSWDKPLEYGGDDIIYYNIYKGTGSNNLSRTFSVNNQTEYVDSNISHNSQYYYKVTAENSVGESNSSNIVNITVDFTPSEPVNFTAEPGFKHVNLSWDKPIVSYGELKEFIIYRGVNSTNLTIIARVDCNVTNYTDLNVTNGRTYYYKIVAVNDYGRGDDSEIVSAKPSAKYVPGFTIISLLITFAVVTFYSKFRKEHNFMD